MDTILTLGGGGVTSLLQKGARYAGKKIIGNAQSTGTFGHSIVSKVYAYMYALDPRVVKVAMDLGYKRALDGLVKMRLKYGPRPDVLAVYRDGSVRIKEIASKTDKPLKLIERNARKMKREGLSGPEPSVSNAAVYMNNIVNKVKSFF